ncbi:hypothetical protein Slin15195_G115220 [Septoria linicola]|uniref:Uncharacterized protein n=1 Tax=Septoria linicola TaxID=215465 RepID=A0A9Q9ER48_9PEZI|nr:hypothetical protein Slin15195_G115220 [Septoria linicola]
MAPSSSHHHHQSHTLTTMSTSTNLGDPIPSKALQRRLKSLAKQQNQQRPKVRIARRKIPSAAAVMLSGKQKLLQHRVNLFRGVEKGSGGASVKRDGGMEEKKTKLARRNKVRRRNAVARKRREGRED